MNERAVPDPPLEPRRLMRAAMLLSSGCLIAGLVSWLWLPHLAHGDALLRAGLLILMATPGLRVILSVGQAARERDRVWLWASVAVALILSGTVVYSLRAL